MMMKFIMSFRFLILMPSSITNSSSAASAGFVCKPPRYFLLKIFIIFIIIIIDFCCDAFSDYLSDSSSPLIMPIMGAQVIFLNFFVKNFRQVFLILFSLLMLVMIGSNSFFLHHISIVNYIQAMFFSTVSGSISVSSANSSGGVRLFFRSVRPLPMMIIFRLLLLIGSRVLRMSNTQKVRDADDDDDGDDYFLFFIFFRIFYLHHFV
jgi:hypothetical protein